MSGGWITKIINLDNSISWIGERSHNRGAARRVTGRHFLPDNGPHVVETDGFTEFDDLGSDGDYFISPIINRPSELITDIDAQAAAVVQNTVAFFPCEVKIVDVLFVGIMKANLLNIVVILELPVRRRRNDKMDGLIRNLRHGTGICYKNLVLIHTVFIR